VQGFARAALPFVRVIGLVYTGLIGMVIMVVVFAVGVTPVGPALEQAAEPARQAMSNLVQPPTDAVLAILGGGGGPAVQIAQSPPSFGPSPTSGFSVSTSALESSAAPVLDDEQPLEESPLPASAESAYIFVAPRQVRQPVLEEFVPEDEPMTELNQPAPPKPIVIVQPGEPIVLQIASEAPPKALPTPTPTETALQAKARLDAENQAAIDAIKAAQVRSKADEDAANQAAIDAQKAALSATPTGVPAGPSAAVSTTTPTTTTQAAKPPTPVPTDVLPAVATAQAKAMADAANQAAIDKAKAEKTPATPLPSPTAPPTVLPTRTPTPVITPARQPAPVQPTAIPALTEKLPVDEALLDEAPISEALVPVPGA
jgi:hypothetical protein